MQNTVKFHEVHGNDVMISNNWTSARRIETKGSGLAFTAQPIKVGEKITVKLVEVSDKSPGVLSIGFTARNPVNLRYDLPKTKMELKKTAGFWICSLSKQLCAKDKVLFFYVNRKGDIVYGFDGEEKGFIEKHITIKEQLWALIDIWSPSTAIMLGNVKNTSCNKPRTRYHFRQKSLNFNEVEQIRILDEGYLSLGVTSCNPATLTQKELPSDPDLLVNRPEYWVVINDRTWKFEKDDELSYVITKEGEMKIWKNSSLLLKVLHVDAGLELWGFVALLTVKKIEIIKTSREEKNANKEETMSHLNDKEENCECVVCCDTSDSAFYPCGHMCMCFNCAKTHWKSATGKCPICRRDIKDVLKLFKA